MLTNGKHYDEIFFPSCNETVHIASLLVSDK